jgi:predicted Zn-dependent peptidase
MVYIDFLIKTGSINERDYESGAAHFLEHMHFKGTKKRSLD